MPRICVHFYPELKLITLSSHFPSGTTPMMHHAFLTTTHALVRLLINHPVYGRGHSFLPVSSVRAVALGVCVGNRRERGRETCGEGLSKNNSSWWRGKATGSWQTGTSPGYMSSCEGPQLGEEIKPECFSSTWSWPFLNIAPSLSFVCARTASAPVVRPSRPPLGLLTEVPQVFQRGWWRALWRLSLSTMPNFQGSKPTEWYLGRNSTGVPKDVKLKQRELWFVMSSL